MLGILRHINRFPEAFNFRIRWPAFGPVTDQKQPQGWPIGGSRPCRPRTSPVPRPGQFLGTKLGLGDRTMTSIFGGEHTMLAC